MFLRQIPSRFMANFSYLLGDEKTVKAAVVDPSRGSRGALAIAHRHRLEIEFVLVTHGHSDHVSELEFFRRNSGAKVVAHETSRVNKDTAVEDGDTIFLGDLPIEVIHTPGHTNDSVCYLVEGNLFTGDTLFVGECGRTDLPGGDSRMLYRSLFHRLTTLPDATKIWPGHDYGRRPSSTLKEEKETSYILEKRTEDEFVVFMREP